MITIMIWRGVSQKSWKWLVSALVTHLLFEFTIILLQKYSPGPWLNVVAVIAFGSILLAILYQLLFKQWVVEHNKAVIASQSKCKDRKTPERALFVFVCLSQVHGHDDVGIVVIAQGFDHRWSVVGICVDRQAAGFDHFQHLT